jgi:uncharacterized protein (TIGR02117 family)
VRANNLLIKRFGPVKILYDSMKRILVRLIKAVLWIAGSFLLFVAVYYAAAMYLPRITTNDVPETEADSILMYVTSNGVHTDLVMPVRTPVIQWDTMISRGDFKVADSTYQWISMGWGDKGFYLNTPTWDDLTFATAFTAVFYLGTTAMHVQYGKEAPFDKIYCRPFKVSPEHYQKLVAYIRESFAYDEQGRVILLPNEGYWETDRFYDAKGRYGFTQTCNTWTNRGMKIAGKRTGIWTAFESGIRRQFD